MLNPDWEIGTAEIVEEEPDLPRTEMEEALLPTIPGELSYEKKKHLEALLREFQDIFAGKGLKLGNTTVIEHEIHTRGPPIRQPYRRQNPEVRRQEQEQLKEMLEQEIVRSSSSQWTFPVVMVKKKDGTLRIWL